MTTALILCICALILAVLLMACLWLKAERQLRRLNRTPQKPAAQPQEPPAAILTETPSTAPADLLDDALQVTRDGLWDWDRTTDALHFNSRFLDMLGYNTDSFPQNQDTWRNLLHPDDKEQAMSRQQKVLESPEYGDTFEHMFRLRAADGSYRWFLGRILNVRRDGDGRAIRVVGANVDITDLKNLNDRVEESDIRLQEALAATCDGVWRWAAKEHTPETNSCIFTMVGQSEHSATTGFTAWAERIHPEDRDLAVSMQMRIVDTAANGDTAECTYRYHTKDGSYRWMLARCSVAQRDAEGRALRMVGVHTDITELKALRTELDVRNERLHYAFAAARDGLWDWDVEEGDVYYSPRYLSMMGYTPDEFAPEQSSWEHTIHPEDRETVMANQARYLASPELGDSFENTYRFRAADGSYRWILSRALVVRRNAVGRGLRVVGLHTDVTEMRRTQESLRVLLQHDTLTGLHSRAHFESRSNAMGDGTQDPVSLIICDLDGLKLINDNLGHNEGDRLLVAAAGILSSSVRRGDVAARIGGDEIALLLPACPKEAAENILQKLRAALDAYNSDTTHPPLFLSWGLATANLRNTTPAALFREADKAMFKSKCVTRPQVRATIAAWLESHLGYAVDTETDCRL